MSLQPSLQMFLLCLLLRCLCASLPAPSHALLFRHDGNAQRLRTDALQSSTATVFVPSRPLQCAASAFAQPAEGLPATRQTDVTVRLGKQQYITPFNLHPTLCAADDSASVMYVKDEGSSNSSSTGSSNYSQGATVVPGGVDDRVPMAMNPQAAAINGAAGFDLPGEDNIQDLNPPLVPLPLPLPQPSSVFTPDPSPSPQQHSFQPNTADQSVMKKAVKKPAPKARPPPPPVARAIPAPSLTPATELFPICNLKGALVIPIPVTGMGIRWKGWGASISWMGNYAGGFTQSRLNSLLDLLFHPKRGLGLSMVRYNIGGGMNPKYSPQMLVDNEYKWRAMPGYRNNPKKGYNWGSDWRQRRFLQGAIQRGVKWVEAVSFSPPWWMTNSGDVAGGKDGKSNLNPKYTQAFADYLADVMKHFSRDWGVNFTTVAPFNEPLEGFWKQGGGQEGCSLTPDGMESITECLERSLAKRKLGTRIVAMDSWIQTTSTNFNLALMSRSSLRQVPRINVHGYLSLAPQGVNARMHTYNAYWTMRKLAQQHRRPMFLSEWGPLGPDGQDLDIALFMGRRIIEAVNILGVSAWFYWQPIDSVPFWSLININWSNPAASAPFPIGFSKKYWVFRHFTTYAKAGSMQMSVSNWTCAHCVATFYHPMAHTLSIFIVNQKQWGVPMTLDLSAWRATSSAPAVTARRTSYYENMAKVGVKTVGQKIILTAMGQSLTSLVVSGVRTR